jgi:hypothetical protein
MVRTKSRRMCRGKVKRADEAKYRNGVVTPKGILVRKPRWDVTAKGVVEVA